MPNTTIQLKKSSTPSAVPADLANGELAINFADGKLFYKNTAGFIAEISGAAGGNFFGTVNANSTLIVADTTGDILTLEAGSGIEIVGDAVNDKIIISAPGGSGATIFNDQIDAIRYITFADATSGTLTRANVDVTLTYNPAANNLSVGNTVFATHFDNTSDRNLKKNIKAIKNGSDVLKLNPVSFNWKATGEKSYGLIAQEVEPVIPEIVHTNHDGMKTIEYVQLISLLISVVQNQQQQIDDINTRLNNMPSNP